MSTNYPERHQDRVATSEELKKHKGIPEEVVKAFPINEEGNIRIGEYVFTAEEISAGKEMHGGTMHRVILLQEHGLVLKFNKKRLIAESFKDIKRQLKVFNKMKDQYPDIEFHFPKTEVFHSMYEDNSYVILTEYIEGQTLKISDIYNNPEIRSQIVDLSKIFFKFMKHTRYPITLDLMGASQGVQCALYGLEIVNDFELGNLLLTKDNKVVMIDTGLSYTLTHSFIRNGIHFLTSLGQMLTMYHMRSIAKGNKESLIR